MFVCGSCGQRYDHGGFCPQDGQPLAATTDALLGTEIGRYRLARLIGEGGMGQVYVAVQPAIGSRVAIKILSDQCARNPELLERFFAEAKAVNLIRHEHIVSVMDLAQLPDGRPYIVMEFIEGHTLAAIVRARRAPIGGVVHVMAEVLSALGAAHQLGIVHRDLKPDNILITGEGHAKVLDFGIAKLAPGLSNALSPRTRTGALLGTPAYMAPEQISGAANVDSRTDIYAAGIVLFEALTGQVPFSGETLYDLMRAHLEVAPPSPSTLRPDLPPALEAVILQALAKDPKDRFQTAQAMTQAMNHAASGLPADQWKPLSSRAASMGQPSMERSLQPTPPDLGRAPTTVATPQPGPRDTTLSTRGRGTWIAVAAAVAAVGAVVVIAMSREGGSSEQAAPPAMVATESSTTSPPAIPTGSPPPVTPPPTPTAVEAPTPATPTPTAPTRGITPATRPANSAGGGAPSTPPPTTGPTIVGGGSAADHGVHIGPGVTVGPNVVIGGGTPTPPSVPAPPTAKKFTRPIDYDPRKFDAVAYAPKALALARTIFPDAGFARFDVHYVFANGLADLTKSDDDSSYVFRSPSHSVRPTDVPRNVEVEIECYVEVTVGAKEVEVRVRDLSPIDSNCKWPLRPLPRCSLAKVWAKAQADGAKSDTVAKIGFLSDGQWFFDNEFDGEGITKSYVDACP